jgi:hypothetical protein
VIKGGMDQYLTPMGPTKLHVNPIFEISPLEPRYSGEDAELADHDGCPFSTRASCAAEQVPDAVA